MKLCTVEYKLGSREEQLPDFDAAFPYVLTRAAFREGENAPWHWHKAAELFYVPSGTLEYITPNGRCVFSAGSGGMVNSNVLHMTRGHGVAEGDCHYLHLFDPALIGPPGSRLEEKYVLPLTAAAQVELLALDARDPSHARALEPLRRSFELDPEEPGYELKLRSSLSEIWLELLKLAAPRLEEHPGHSMASEQTKQMLIFIHEHFGEKLTVKQIAAAACVSERSCFELFRNNLRTTPMDYLTGYRLREACQRLAQTYDTVTEISSGCGMSGSYFCHIFRENTGFTPLEYRRIHRRHRQTTLETLPLR